MPARLCHAAGLCEGHKELSPRLILQRSASPTYLLVKRSTGRSHHHNVSQAAKTPQLLKGNVAKIARKTFRFSSVHMPLFISQRGEELGLESLGVTAQPHTHIGLITHRAPTNTHTHTHTHTHTQETKVHALQMVHLTHAQGLAHAYTQCSNVSRKSQFSTMHETLDSEKGLLSS